MLCKSHGVTAVVVEATSDDSFCLSTRCRSTEVAFAIGRQRTNEASALRVRHRKFISRCERPWWLERNLDLPPLFVNIEYGALLTRALTLVVKHRSVVRLDPRIVLVLENFVLHLHTVMT